jgi:hypothetical protein
MPPIERPLIIGRKNIMEFLQITNWDSVLRLQSKGGLPIGKLEGGGRWCGKRVNLQRWLDKSTNAGGANEGEPVKDCKNLQDFTPQSAVDFSQVWSRWRTPRMEKFLVAYRDHGLIARACKTAGITRPTFYNWKKNYERFAAACTQIQIEVYGHAATEETAVR